MPGPAPEPYNGSEHMVRGARALSAAHQAEGEGAGGSVAAGGLLYRMGLDDRHYTILGVKIRELVIPVRPGRDMASILEVAARNELLKNAGHHAAREFFGNLEGALLSERPPDESAVLPPVTRQPRSPLPESAAPKPRGSG